MFHLYIALSLAASSPVQQTVSVAPGAAVAVCFSPEEDCASFAVRAIDNAESEILVSAYGLTTGSALCCMDRQPPAAEVG